jgi:hypothetical protein
VNCTGVVATGEASYPLEEQCLKNFFFLIKLLALKWAYVAFLSIFYKLVRDICNCTAVLFFLLHSESEPI